MAGIRQDAQHLEGCELNNARMEQQKIETDGSDMRSEKRMVGEAREARSEKQKYPSLGCHSSRASARAGRTFPICSDLKREEGAT